MTQPEASVPATYREIRGCHNCSQCFQRTEYDEGRAYFCTLNAPPRPPCMSVSMGETPDNFGDYDAEYRAWDAWSEPREVAAWGYCDNWAAIDIINNAKSPKGEE